MDKSQITLKDPQCPECSCIMLLGIEPGKPGYEARTFECPRFLYVDNSLVEA
jgi:hypothetical protein